MKSLPQPSERIVKLYSVKITVLKGDRLFEEMKLRDMVGRGWCSAPDNRKLKTGSSSQPRSRTSTKLSAEGIHI